MEGKVVDDNDLGDWDAGWVGFSYGSPEDTGMNYLLKSKAVDNFPRLNDSQLDAYLRILRIQKQVHKHLNRQRSFKLIFVDLFQPMA